MHKTKNNKYQSRSIHPVKFVRQLFNRVNIVRKASKYLLVSAISLVIFFGLAAGAEAANHYVRAGATGSNNGNDWTNAYTILPPTLTRGDTYYIADGSYSSYTFDDAVSETKVITIKKATASDHGTDTGWQSSYGDGQAIFNSTLTFTTSNWIFDGQTRNENDWFDGASYGFRLYHNNLWKNIRICNGSASVNNIILQYVYTEGMRGCPQGGEGPYSIYIGECGGIVNHNITISRVYTYGYSNSFFLRDTDTTLVEYSASSDTCSNGNNHGEPINLYFNANNSVIRYNKIRNAGSSDLGMHTAMIGITQRNGGNNGGHQIYGNLIWNFKSTDAAIGYGTRSGDYTYNNRIYNNTFVNGTGSYNTGILLQTPGISDNLVYNNLWINCPNIGFTATHDYNAFSDSNAHGEAHAQTNLSTTIFQNYSGNDFRLTAPTNAGIKLDSPYNYDLSGSLRGSDGTWDRGAFEYVSGPPQSAYTLTMVKSGTGSGTVTGTGIDCGSDCTETIDTGTSVTLTASPDSDSVFSGWSGGGCSGTGACTVTMNSDITVTASFNHPGESVNLLINGDFESGFTNGLGNGWQMTTDGNVVYSVSEDNGHQGFGQKITVATPGSWGLFFYQTPAFELNQSYTWSFWYKTQGGELRAQITDPPRTEAVFEKQLPDTNGEWQQAAYTFQYTNSQATQLRFSSNTAGTYWLDNVQLVAGADDTTPPAPPTGLAVN